MSTPDGGRTLFRDYAEQWRAAKVLLGGTATQIEINLRLTPIRACGRQLGAVPPRPHPGLDQRVTGDLAPPTVELNYR